MKLRIWDQTADEMDVHKESDKWNITMKKLGVKNEKI